MSRAIKTHFQPVVLQVMGKMKRFKPNCHEGNAAHVCPFRNVLMTMMNIQMMNVYEMIESHKALHPVIIKQISWLKWCVMHINYTHCPMSLSSNMAFGVE